MSKLNIIEANLKAAMQNAERLDMDKAFADLSKISEIGISPTLYIALSEFTIRHYKACIAEEKNINRLPSVYFLQSIESGLIKIGQTSHGIEKRIAQISGMCPGGVKLIAIVREANKDLEFELHRMFKSLRVNGEWFSPGAKLIDYIDGLKT